LPLEFSVVVEVGAADDDEEEEEALLSQNEFGRSRRIPLVVAKTIGLAASEIKRLNLFNLCILCNVGQSAK
jgi:hypothetical protein